MQNQCTSISKALEVKTEIRRIIKMLHKKTLCAWCWNVYSYIYNGDKSP